MGFCYQKCLCTITEFTTCEKLRRKVHVDFLKAVRQLINVIFFYHRWNMKCTAGDSQFILREAAGRASGLWGWGVKVQRTKPD